MSNRASPGSTQLSYRITGVLDELRDRLGGLVGEDELGQIFAEELEHAREEVREEIRKQLGPEVKHATQERVKAWVQGQPGSAAADMLAMRLGRELLATAHEHERKRLLEECTKALAREKTPKNCVGKAIVEKLNAAVQAAVDKLVEAWVASDGPVEIAEKAMEDLGPSVESFDVASVAGLVMRDLPARATAMFNFEVARAVLSRSLQPLEVHVQAVTAGDVNGGMGGLGRCSNCQRWGQINMNCQCGSYIHVQN